MNFRNARTPPPGGEFFFEHGGERISARTWFEFLPKMQDMIAKHGLHGTPLDLAAQYMCPRIPSWYCTSGGVPVLSTDAARAAAKPYFGKNVVTPSEIASRMAVCRSCPRHERTVCLTCTGIASWAVSSFGGRRPALPEDRMSGVCRCAGTFDMVVASVDSRELSGWKDVPDTCWRNKG